MSHSSRRPIAYLIPEFPGQTHIWMWREISHMRDWDVDLRLFSTRPPDDESAARHAFAASSRASTTYLWPRTIGSMLGAVAWAVATRPVGFVRAGLCSLRLDDISLRQRLASLALLAPASVLARDLASQRIQHVHVHSAGRSAVIAMMVSRLNGITYSLTLNANLEWWGGGMASKLGNSEFTVVITEWLRDQIRERFVTLRPSQVVLGRIGVDTQKWTPTEQVSVDTTFRLATVARLHHAKGHDVAIQAVSRLREAGRDVRLSIIGAGPERAELEALVGRLGIDGIVELAGSLSEDDVIVRLRAADAFVLASRFEPLGVAYMEAMSLALPTIGTDTGGVGEIITSEQDGLLVPPDDDTSLADAIARLMDDPELGRRLGSNGRQAIVERFDSRFGAATLYERLFGVPPPHSEAPG